MFLQQARYFSIAFHHLSLFPSSQRPSASPQELGRSFIYFPLVGFVFGLGLMAFYYFLSPVLGKELVCLLVLLFLFLFFNERQWQACVQFIDLLVPPERYPEKERQASLSGDEVLRIAVLFFSFMLKFLALMHVGSGWILGVLILLPTFSCWSLVYLSHSLAFTSIADRAPFSYLRFVKTREFWGATVFVTVAAVSFLEIKGLFLLMAVSLGTAVFERLYLLKCREDIDLTLRSVMELNEVGVLFAALMMQKAFSIGTADWVML